MFLKLFKGREILLAAVVNSNLHLAIYINLGVCYFFAFFGGGGVIYRDRSLMCMMSKE